MPVNYTQKKKSLQKGIYLSSFKEEATGTGRLRDRACVGGWLSSDGVRASTLDSSPKARARMEELLPMSCKGSGPILLLKQRVLTSLQLLHPSPWGY